MDTKLTAVEWLRYQTLEGTIDKLENVMYLKLPIDVFIKAQEMEKEQIKDAAYHGVNFENSPYKNVEEYYNEYYGKNNI
jgi:hypothetical protein